MDHLSTALLKRTTQLFKKRTHVTPSGDSLTYDLLEPANIEPGKQYPLVVFFHGDGERGPKANHLVHFVYVFTKEEARKQFPCFVLVPHLKQNAHWTYGNTKYPATAGSNGAMQVIQEVLAKHPVDRKKISATGLSSGGAMVIDCVLRNPNLFAAGVLMSSYWNFTEEQAPAIKGFPLWITAGTQDHIVPNVYNDVMLLKLQKYQAKPSYHVYTDTGHLSWISLYTSQEFLPWLFRQEQQSNGVKVAQSRP